MDGLVSVIIPTYKRSERLQQAIESVLHQTYQNIEIIVVDDNDSDTQYRKDNENKMLKYQNYSNIKYIKHEKNKNGAVARNTGIKNASGEYIAFLDDDDTYFKDKIEKQVTFLKSHQEYNCVGCEIYRGGKVKKQKVNEQTLVMDIISLKVSPITSTLLFREEAIREINGFDEKYKRHQDVEMIIRYLQNNRFGYIEEPLIEMGINEGENSLKGQKLEDLKEQFLKDFADVIEKLENSRKGSKKKIICRHYASNVINHLKNKNYNLIGKTLKKSFIHYPICFSVTLIKMILYRMIIHMKK